MKVIKEGKWNVPWSGESTCSTCDAVLLIEEVDVKPVDYGSGYFYACCVCGKHNVMNEKMLPLRIKEEKNKTRKYSSGDPY